MVSQPDMKIHLTRLITYLEYYSPTHAEPRAGRGSNPVLRTARRSYSAGYDRRQLWMRKGGTVGGVLFGSAGFFAFFCFGSVVRPPSSTLICSIDV